MGTYLIAGGGRGIGGELVRRLAPSAERIDVWSRSAEGIADAAAVRHHNWDATSAEPPPEPPESIQGAVYCPGTVNLKSFRALTEDDFRRDWEVNLLGAVRFLKACQTRLKGADGEPASVVLFSTVAVGQGMPMHASVAAAKGAVEGLVRSLAAEWAPKVRVNAIAPALVDTPLVDRMLGTPEKREAMSARYPLKRVGTPSDAAALARFLLSPESGWITGQVLGLDGGMSTLRV
ncbi:MAG: SDR family oxidoreductase [Mycobacterium sp.]|nr:SDR family oxidoreductase [Mycobacterium sp.]